MTLLYLFLGMGCTDAGKQKFTNYGSSTHITCWSGGQVIYDGHSTGRVSWQEGGGALWVDTKTGKLVETFADCIFEVGQ